MCIRDRDSSRGEKIMSVWKVKQEWMQKTVVVWFGALLCCLLLSLIHILFQKEEMNYEENSSLHADRSYDNG